MCISYLHDLIRRSIAISLFLSPFFVIQSSFALIDPCSSGSSTKTFCDINVSVAAVNDSRAKNDAVKPKGSLLVTVTGKLNPKIDPKGMTLTFTGNSSYWSNANLPFKSYDKKTKVVTFSKTLSAPVQIGQHELSWTSPTISSTSTGNIIKKKVEVTCSDSNFSNGEERYVFVSKQKGYQCVDAVQIPCTDSAACTANSIDAANLHCIITPQDSSCASCSGASCAPNCATSVCGGDDGCGGTCLTGSCTGGQICNAGACIDGSSAPKSCYNPSTEIVYNPNNSGQTQVIYGNNENGLSVFGPVCNANSAKEQVYIFTIPEGAGTNGVVGFNAQTNGYVDFDLNGTTVTGIDSVLDLRKINPTTDPQQLLTQCLNSPSVGCSDDSTPPGNYGSRITKKLGPGTYMLVVDGFNSGELGNYKLEVTFFNSGCLPSCEGASCGASFATETECANFQCGTCSDGTQCSLDPLDIDKFRQCLPTQCFDSNYTPTLPKGSECGKDDCGNVIGCTTPGELCVYDPAEPGSKGQCKPFQACNNFLPNCGDKCLKGEYCGSDCECHPLDEKLPDLVLSTTKMAQPGEVIFEKRAVAPSSCGFQEQCFDNTIVPAPAVRYLVRFPVEAVNQGIGQFAQQDPVQRPDLYEYQSCHGHFHYNGFAKYELLDANNNVVLVGGKRSYCLEDTYQWSSMLGPDYACDPLYDCEAQGLQTGWVDLYSNDLDCQWLDVTRLVTDPNYTPTTFKLKITTNASRAVNEETFDNNAGEILIEIPTKEGFLDLNLISNAPSPHK